MGEEHSEEQAEKARTIKFKQSIKESTEQKSHTKLELGVSKSNYSPESSEVIRSPKLLTEEPQDEDERN